MFAVFFHSAHFLLLIAHFLLLIAHFMGKPECITPRHERFSAQQGVEKQVGLRWLFWKNKVAGLAIFRKEKNGLVMG